MKNTIFTRYAGDRLAQVFDRSTPRRYNTVGMYFGESILWVSRQREGRDEKNKRPEEISWNGSTGFVVPPCCLDFKCTSVSTCREILSEYLGSVAAEESRLASDTPVFLTVGFPEGGCWDDDRDRFAELVKEQFNYPNFIAAPASLSQACMATEKNKSGMIQLFMDENRTNIRYLANGKSKHDLEVPLGCRNVKLNGNIRLRMNDYRHGTNLWSEECFASWRDCLKSVLDVVKKWPDASYAQVLCDDECYDFILNSGILPANVRRIKNPAEMLLKYACSEAELTVSALLDMNASKFENSKRKDALDGKKKSIFDL